ncbi:M1 family metallopeptidase [Catenulispora sp. NL8]|uniref:Aminopeptidase N n=1 Tax=Catenulispora pinistramenti TaxID=2705254 RepID=A0ABS5L724_9ACTN|nr:M1 family metallopeptidase [Catenulispora pinistramenti]MBS2554156.1 M1 family metallopeptidase [Catenulispora pinistramenti]
MRRVLALAAAAVTIAVTAACGGSGSAAKPAVADPWSAGRSTPVADDVYPRYGDPATDVEHYGLDLKWDPTTTVLTGTATLAVRAARPTDRFVLDLAADMSADTVSVNGAPVADVHDGDHLTVPVGKPLPADATATVVIGYHGVPHLVPAPMTRSDIAGLGAQVTAGGGVWAQQEPYGAFTWYPCNDQPSDKALYDVSITAPDGWAGVSGGSFVGRTESGGSAGSGGSGASGGFGVYRWHQPNPVATYLVAFAVDRFAEDTATGPHGIPLTYWYLPADADAVHRLTARIPDMITFLEQRFGPYPFPTGGVLFRPEQVGMETQTMITLSAHSPAADLLHEFAHQWFGDAVTPRTWSGLWLNEGFAAYAQYLWQAAYPAGGNPPTTIDAVLRDRAVSQDQELRSVDGPPGHYKPGAFASSNVYDCPALMLNGLRHALGDAAFYRLLSDWVHQNQGTNQDRNTFEAFVDAHTGRDFTPYINAWLDSPTTPTIPPPS